MHYSKGAKRYGEIKSRANLEILSGNGFSALFSLEISRK